MSNAPAYLEEGTELWNPFTGKKKYIIQCHNCSHIYVERVPWLNHTDRASSVCPRCRELNVWNHAAFVKSIQLQRRLK